MFKKQKIGVYLHLAKKRRPFSDVNLSTGVFSLQNCERSLFSGLAWATVPWLGIVPSVRVPAPPARMTAHTCWCAVSHQSGTWERSALSCDAWLCLEPPLSVAVFCDVNQRMEALSSVCISQKEKTQTNKSRRKTSVLYHLLDLGYAVTA